MGLPLGAKVLAEFIGIPADEFLRLKHLSEEVQLSREKLVARTTTACGNDVLR